MPLKKADAREIEETLPFSTFLLSTYPRLRWKAAYVAGLRRQGRNPGIPGPSNPVVYGRGDPDDMFPTYKRNPWALHWLAIQLRDVHYWPWPLAGAPLRECSGAMFLHPSLSFCHQGICECGSHHLSVTGSSVRSH